MQFDFSISLNKILKSKIEIYTGLLIIIKGRIRFSFFDLKLKGFETGALSLYPPPAHWILLGPVQASSQDPLQPHANHQVLQWAEAGTLVLLDHRLGHTCPISGHT